MPPIGRFAPNFTQTTIKPYCTIMNMYVIIRQYFVRISKITCFQCDMLEFVVLYFAHFMDYQNAFDNFLSGGSTDGTCAVWCKLVKSSRRSSKK